MQDPTLTREARLPEAVCDAGDGISPEGAVAAPVARPRTLQSIQALRAVAAGAVLLFHARLLSIGFAGVDIFFVISGFIMGTIGVGERPWAFAGRRIARVVPLYWTVTLVTCALALVPGMMRNFHPTWPALLQSLLFIPFRDANGGIFPLIVAGWTLNFEMFFYAVFALALLTRRPRLVALAALATLVACGLLLQPAGAVPQTYTSPLLLEFGAGIALAGRNPVRGRLCGLLALMAGTAGFVAMALVGDLGVEGMARALLLGGPSLLVVAGALALELGGAWPRMPIVRAIGDASYSLYLTHELVVPAAGRVAAKVGLAREPMIAFQLVAAVLFALAAYRWFEKPLNRMLR